MTNGQDSVLPPTLVNKSSFLDLFYEPVTTAILAKANIHLHVMRLDGGEFPLSRMYTELSNATLGYVLSRQNMNKLRADASKTVEFVNKVQAQFKLPDEKNGEGGEVLLYAFLEGHLEAPKVLTKMELKTSPNDYVKGADGLHLLEVAPNQYQLIFGEAKMYGDSKGNVGDSVQLGIKAAFVSMAKVRDGSFDFDTWLVQSELLKEQVDEAKLELLASILLPSGGATDVEKTNAFGVLIGFEINIDDLHFEDLESVQIETVVRETADRLIADQIATIKEQIKHYSLGGYHFHFYAVPFLKRTIKGKEVGIQQVRVDLAKALGNRK